MTEFELFQKARGAYLTLIHLGEDLDVARDAILGCASEVSPELIASLLVGQSWRERLLGLTLGCHVGIADFYQELLDGLHDVRGISTVPMAAVISIVVMEYGCEYTPELTASMDRDAFDGEMGWALDCMHHAMGIGELPKAERGPNYAQHFDQHRDFYLGLCS